YPAAQIAVARHGKLGLVWTLGDARLPPERVPARDETLWLLFSNTKVITACAVWLLVERGALAFTDRVADHVPGFEANGKGESGLRRVVRVSQQQPRARPVALGAARSRQQPRARLDRVARAGLWRRAGCS